MSKKQFKSKASSNRIVPDFLNPPHGLAGSTGFGVIPSSRLSYVYEPPVLTAISAPNIVVAFKNLQKKDATTKSKALDELRSYISAVVIEEQAVEDSILTTWMNLYPRTSIDSSRRVRQLAHSLQGEISVACGKRLVKHLPGVIGPWLSGLFDNDKSVSRAAQESFSATFPTPEKQQSVWTIYHSAILEYCRDVLVQETVNTLSDERITSPDDAEAKYSRVVGTSVLVLGANLDALPLNKIEKQTDLYQELLSHDLIWRFCSHVDPYVRKASYKLLVVVLTKKADLVDLPTISSNVLAEALQINQSGSAYEYIKTLAQITHAIPELWTDYYPKSAKKSATKRLCGFLKKGSQGAQSGYWSQVSVLLEAVPSSITLKELDASSFANGDDKCSRCFPLLDAFRDGISRRDEPRAGQGFAWHAYLDCVGKLISSTSDPTTRHRVLNSCVLPLICYYIMPGPEQFTWASISHHSTACVEAASLISKTEPDVLLEAWPDLSRAVSEQIATSSSEQAKDYVKSQDAVVHQAKKWYTLQAAILESKASSSLRTTFTHFCALELQSAMATLVARKGKPYGAAATVENAIRLLPTVTCQHESTRELLLGFAQRDIPSLILSPSSTFLFSILVQLGQYDDLAEVYASCVDILASESDSKAKTDATMSLISSAFLAHVLHSEKLLKIVRENLSNTLDNDEKAQSLTFAAMKNPYLPSDLRTEMLSTLSDNLMDESRASQALTCLEKIVQNNRDAVRSFIMSSDGSKLMSRLLLLTEHHDGSISRRSHDLLAGINTTGLRDEPDFATKAMLGIIKNDLATAGPNSLTIDSLVDQAQKLLRPTEEPDRPGMTAHLLPSGEQFEATLVPLLNNSPNTSLAITNSLGGSIYFISNMSSVSPTKESEISRDRDGYSPALRMAWYSALLIRDTHVFEFMTSDHQIAIYCYLSLIAQLATDHLSVPGSNLLWAHGPSDNEAEPIEFLRDIQALLASWLQNRPGLEPKIIHQGQDKLLSESDGRSTKAYYSARAYRSNNLELTDSYKKVGYSIGIPKLRELRESPSFSSTLCLLHLQDENTLIKLTNQFVSDITGSSLQSNIEDPLRDMILLNLVIEFEDDILHGVQQQRLVFLFKHVIAQMQKETLAWPVTAEASKIVTAISLRVNDTYDSFWVQSLDLLMITWARPSAVQDDAIPGIHASLKLLGALRDLSGLEDTSEDLTDSLSDKRKSLTESLLQLVVRMSGIPDENHQPRKILNQFLTRSLSAIAPDLASPYRDLYPVLASESAALQHCAFDLLHKEIPPGQQQASLDAALEEDSSTKLPEELLSLILTVPDWDESDSVNSWTMTSQHLRSYLLSWKLVFDHWTNASYKLQADYANQIREGSYMKGLLDFSFEILISSRQKPVDASKFDIATYSPSFEDVLGNDTQRLLSHLYYLSLRYLPNLARSWWRDSSPRQLLKPVESWTEKYISPLVVQSELAVVADWIASQPAENESLQVKVSVRAREMTASYPIDDQVMSIAIRLPAAYPLQPVVVESVHRVGIDEKKWRSWLVTTQGVINFSSSGGSLIDGLVAWKKNVVGAIKGQSECAICYSVIGADRQLPSKRCGTCKNLFHSGCLFRWFKSSNSSSCPLCRNAFNYG